MGRLPAGDFDQTLIGNAWPVTHEPAGPKHANVLSRDLVKLNWRSADDANAHGGTGMGAAARTAAPRGGRGRGGDPRACDRRDDDGIGRSPRSARILSSMAKAPKAKKPSGKPAHSYRHPTDTLPMRPEIGTQANFRKKKAPRTYRYDSSLSPALEWDGAAGRDLGEWLIDAIERASVLPAPHAFAQPVEFKDAGGATMLSVSSLQEAVAALKRLSKPFLNWTGKTERLSFDVPTLPLFVHERLSTQKIVQTLIGHKTDKQVDMFDLFGDPHRSIVDQTLHAYEYPDNWVNRLILGDSLVVMNSLLHYEGLGGQVQMIYIDPPYGVKFGSNFQPFVRKRDVSHNDDEDLTREPEMVKAYRDTWELGLHSYLTYMRDRLLLARDLLTPSGSVFVQISDENLHHVHELMDEVFGSENAVVTIAFKKKRAATPTDPVNDYLIWYCRDRQQLRVNPLFLKRRAPEDDPKFNTMISPTWEMKRLKELEDGETERLLSLDWRFARVNYPLVSQDENDRSRDFVWNGKAFKCGRNRHWTFDPDAGMNRLREANRLFDGGGDSLGGVVFWDDWPFLALSNMWDDIHGDPDPIYVVQTSYKVLQRCVLMTTQPGDLVVDPTCGSGTTAYVAEQWGRRWITVDTSRVPLALARQRLLTATYDYYRLKERERGPAGGFVYKRKQNKKGEDVGGIVPHVTLKSIANNEPPDEEVLVDRPEIDSKIVRVTGPFAFEATIPTPVDWESDGIEDSGSQQAEEYGSFVERMIEVLRRSPVLHLARGKTVTLGNIRPPAKSLSLSAEGVAINGEPKAVAFVFGPENGAISEKLVHSALQEAQLKSYTHLYVIGFAIQPHAREFIEKSTEMGLVPATYVQATPDLMMGDLLKNMRSSQIFSVCGLPEVREWK